MIAIALRPTYSAEEFAVEILEGKRSAKWVRAECKGRRIKSVTRRPYVIPRSEAERFTTGK